LCEGILIKWYNDEAVLDYVPSERSLTTEFAYQWDQGYSTYFIATQRASRPGYASVGDQSTHLLIVKTDAIEAGQGIDVSFIKALYGLLTQRYKPVAYKEGGNDQWIDAIVKQAKEANPRMDILEPPQGNYQQSQVPDYKAGSSNMQNITRSMSVSKPTGSWAYILEHRGSPQLAISTVLDAMRKAAQPLLDHNLIDYYEVMNRASNKVLEIKYSPAGEQKKQENDDDYSKNIAHIKYLASFAGPSTINTVNHILDLDEHTKQIQPKNYRIPFPDVYRFIHDHRSGNYFLRLLIYAMQNFDQEKLNVAEEITKYDSEKSAQFKRENPTNKYIPNYLEMASFDVVGLWDREQQTEQGRVLWGQLDDLLDATRDLKGVFDKAELLKRIVPRSFEQFQTEVSKAVNEFFEKQGYTDDANIDLEALKEQFADANRGETVGYPALVSFRNQLDLSRQKKAILDAIAEGLEEQESRTTKRRDEEKAKAEEKRKEDSFLLQNDAYKYLVLPQQKHWEEIPDRYLKYLGSGLNDIDVADFVMNDTKIGLPMDIEGIRYDALDKAEEELATELPEKPSESYGTDDAEVDGDIDYDWEDFVKDYEFEDIDEETPEDEVIEKIKNDYRDDFIDWKKGKLQEIEEGEDSWKYEVDPSDVERKAWDIEAEVAEEEAWKHGLVTLKKEKPDEVEIWVHSKYYKELVPLIKNMAHLNMVTRDDEFDEPILRAHNRIEVYLVDKNESIRKSVYDWSQITS
jgi:hypothetical protein